MPMSRATATAEVTTRRVLTTRVRNSAYGRSFSLRCSYMSECTPLRAIRLQRHGAPLIAENIADPLPGAGEVVIDVRAAGVCHSDAHYRVDPKRTTVPRTLGHEIAGINVATGERVGIHYLLPNGDMIGKELDGGYAEKIAVPSAN